jgi:hypothetical protein
MLIFEYVRGTSGYGTARVLLAYDIPEYWEQPF